MEAKTYELDIGSGSSATHDVQTELIALRADIQGLAESVQRLAVEAPSLAKESLEGQIRRDPLRATAIAAGVGFVLALILVR